VALRSALREDPDVVLVGEMRDYETIAAALTVAETGHLVFATLHTNSAAQTIDRIIDVFPEHQQAQVRMQLSNTLEAVVAQRLIPANGGGRIPATEVLLSTPAVRNTIREGKTHQIDNIIQTSGELGMMSLEASLAYWVKAGNLDLSVAQEYALRPEEVVRLVKGNT
jgi:twitching motility protein PilT